MCAPRRILCIKTLYVGLEHKAPPLKIPILLHDGALVLHQLRPRIADGSDGRVLSAETITITDLDPGTTVVVSDLEDKRNGGRFVKQELLTVIESFDGGDGRSSHDELVKILLISNREPP